MHKVMEIGGFRSMVKVGKISGGKQKVFTENFPNKLNYISSFTDDILQLCF